MDSPKIPMSFDEFDTIEHLLGWKTEYWDGYARFTSRGMGVETCLDFESVSTTQDTSHTEFTFITPKSDHTQQMIDGYIASFINSVEFCGWPITNIFEEAHRDISLYFEGKRGKPLSASAIALHPKTQQVIALSLITEKIIENQQSARLELLYVRPPYQRQGIGTDLIHHSVRALSQQGYSQLTSRYHICNHHSREFYHRLGFGDVCDRYYLQIYTGWLRNEIHRRESLGMLDEIEEMKQERKQLENKLEALEEEFSRSIREAVR
ncbi:N-acetyltransferase [cf. Phormidesmis sp. LEGE 11477]|uniref:GNAT family N-acetyltransferase n=1 Tax=cf. Phormidesmis sp. LEGE 11477 TaxID=1828680 RepID=UPI0019F370C4|nr:GNAT family N-acetyltransferase [cf. Phormidesmis sp. LEGE 11477]MBE9061649.1 GNAT family N-acetyltransferase [cf. Phormidesmis sp. LEGE 11477]